MTKEDKIKFLQKSKERVVDYAKQWIEEEYKIDLPHLRLEK